MAVINYECPNCGAEIKFNPATGEGKCDFCLSTFSIEELENITKRKYQEHLNESDLEPEKHNEEWDNLSEEIKVYSCPRCGAEVISENNTTATFCCYCHSAVVLSDKLAGEFRPSKVIPFKYDKDYATEKLLEWCKKKRFLPSEFSSHKQLEKISGIYVPFWLVDTKVDGQFSATGKVIKTWRQGDYKYTKTDIYSIYRRAKMDFENVPNNASTKLEDKIIESIEPYNYSEMDNFKVAYLPGFLAEKYDRSKKDVFPTVEGRVKTAVNSVLRNSITGYSSVTERGSNTSFEKTEFKYALLPVWLMTYNYKNKTYVYAMNGQTGKVFGYLPVCKKKLAILYVVLFVVIFAAAYLGGRML